MSGVVLVDTDVFSFFCKSDSRADLYRPDLAGTTVVLSFMSVAEIHAWALQRRWGEARRKTLDTILANYAIVNPDDLTARTWAQIMFARRSAGLPIETGDCWIAALAVRHGLPLATHNARDYAGIANLKLISHAPES